MLAVAEASSESDIESSSSFSYLTNEILSILDKAPVPKSDGMAVSSVTIDSTAHSVKKTKNDIFFHKKERCFPIEKWVKERNWERKKRFLESQRTAITLEMRKVLLAQRIKAGHRYAEIMMAFF